MSVMPPTCDRKNKDKEKDGGRRKMRSKTLHGLMGIPICYLLMSSLVRVIGEV